MRRLLLVTLLLLLSAVGANAQGVTQCLVNSVWVPCSSAPQPSFAQASVSAKSSGSVASINAAYGSSTFKGNTLVVVFSNGNNNNPAAPITDTLSLTWFKAVQVANSTAFETEIWYAPNTVGGSDTVTVTPGGSNASIAMTIYEVQGLVYPAANSSPNGPQAVDQTTSNTGTGGTSPSVSVTPILPNEYVFVGFGLGTAAQTITVVSPYNNDSGQQNPTTPAGLFSFVSASLFKTDMATTSPSATATSEPWAVAVASFKTISNPFQGTVQGMGTAGTPSGGVHSVQGVSGGQALPVTCTSGSNCPVNATLQAGSAIVGKVGIDQTTPGTTNAVQDTNLPTTVDTNTGNASASTIREAVATNNPAIANWGHGATNAAPPSGGTQTMAVSATALPTAVTVTDTVAPMADKFGRQITIPFAMRDLIKMASVQTTNATQTTLLASQTSQFADLVSLTITNETATACTVALTDGTTTYKLNVGNQQGAGFTWNPATPVPAASTATAWQVTGCASATLDYVAEFVLNK